MTERRSGELQRELVRIGGAAESLTSRLSRWLRHEAQHAAAADLAHYCDIAGQPVPDLALTGGGGPAAR